MVVVDSGGSDGSGGGDGGGGAGGGDIGALCNALLGENVFPVGRGMVTTTRTAR